MDYNTEKREKASLFLPVKICEVGGVCLKDNTIKEDVKN
jgi:hypothetical protein